AAWQDLTSGRVISGGSTLTMQVARLLDPHPKTFGGKIRQLWRALQRTAKRSAVKIQGQNFTLRQMPFLAPLFSRMMLGKSKSDKITTTL
ncbi:transglycosylase domain-containing protein, partial [Escherichia coli]|nr:transglycosylase domain-containing protein [Escherichia coli]